MILGDDLIVYTDGSSYSSPRRGGIGIRFLLADAFGEEVTKDIEVVGYKGATNNQMELQACITALKEALELEELNDVSRILVHTDSMYIVDNYKNAMWKWPPAKWRNRHGRPVENAAQWKELVKYIRKTQKIVEFKWVKGHSKDKHNKAVDKSAKKSAKDLLGQPLTNVGVRRKLTSESVDINSVKMLGQRISIRIVTAEFLKVQKINRYKYEVISKKSPYYKKMDIIFSYEILKEGHSYYVRFNKESKNPTIVKVFREITS